MPYIVRWPGRVPPGTVSHEMVSLIDTYATIASVLGKDLPPATGAHAGAEDSFNILPAWLGDDYEKPIRDFMILSSSTGNAAVRSGKYKYISGKALDPRIREEKQGARRGETDDISSQNPEIVARFKTIYETVASSGRSRDLDLPLLPSTPVP